MSDSGGMRCIVRFFFSSALVPGLLLTASSLTYPLLWCGMSHFEQVRLFSHGTLALLALLLISLEPERLRRFFAREDPLLFRMIWMLAPAGIVLLLHYYRRPGDSGMLLEGMYALTLILLGAVCWRRFSRALLWYLGVLGVIAGGVTATAVWRGGAPYGLCGNWNWSATLVVAGLAAASRIAFRRLWPGVMVATALVLLPGRVFLPRGTLTALAAAAGLLCLLRSHGRIAAALSICWVCAVLVGGALLLNRSDDGVRIGLICGAVSLIGEHPLMGVGPGRFPAEIRRCLPDVYHQSAFAAEFNPHPHNEPLLLVSEFGFAGVLLCLAVMLAAGSAALKIRRSSPCGGVAGRMSALWFLLVFVGLHGQCDMLLRQWPMDVFFWVGAGVCWGYASGGAFVRPQVAAGDQPRGVRWPLHAVRIVLLIFLATHVVRNAASGWHARAAMTAMTRGDRAAAAASWTASRRWKPDARNLYACAAAELFDRKDPVSTLRLLDQLQSVIGAGGSYMHSHGLRARALAAQGRMEQSLPFFAEEQRDYPLGAVNLDLWRQTLAKLGRGEAAGGIQRRLNELMRRKKLPLSFLPQLRRHPEWDVNVHRIPSSVLKGDGG